RHRDAAVGLVGQGAQQGDAAGQFDVDLPDGGLETRQLQQRVAEIGGAARVEEADEPAAGGVRGAQVDGGQRGAWPEVLVLRLALRQRLQAEGELVGDEHAVESDTVAAGGAHAGVVPAVVDGDALAGDASRLASTTNEPTLGSASSVVAMTIIQRRPSAPVE